MTSKILDFEPQKICIGCKRNIHNYWKKLIFVFWADFSHSIHFPIPNEHDMSGSNKMEDGTPPHFRPDVRNLMKFFQIDRQPDKDHLIATTFPWLNSTRLFVELSKNQVYVAHWHIDRLKTHIREEVWNIKQDSILNAIHELEHEIGHSAMVYRVHLERLL